MILFELPLCAQPDERKQIFQCDDNSIKRFICFEVSCSTADQEEHLLRTVLSFLIRKMEEEQWWIPCCRMFNELLMKIIRIFNFHNERLNKTCATSTEGVPLEKACKFLSSVDPQTIQNWTKAIGEGRGAETARFIRSSKHAQCRLRNAARTSHRHASYFRRSWIP